MTQTTLVRRQSTTLSTIDKSGSKIDRNSVFDCHWSPVGRPMAIKNTVPIIFYLRSSIVLVFSIAPYLVCKQTEGSNNLMKQTSNERYSRYNRSQNHFVKNEPIYYVQMDINDAMKKLSPCHYLYFLMMNFLGTTLFRHFYQITVKPV